MLERILLRSRISGGWILYTAADSTNYLYGIATDSNGNVFAAGARSSDCYLVKVNSSGIFQWDRTLGGISSDDWNDVDIDGSGNIYCFGRSLSSTAGGSDIQLAKYDTNAGLTWQRRLGGTGLDTGTGGAVNSSGSVFFGGWGNTQTAGNADYLIGSYNTSGTIQWQRRFGGAQFESSYGAAIDASNNVYVAGNGNTQTAGGPDALLVKYNSTGTIQWQRRLGGANDQSFYAVETDASSNVFACGVNVTTGASIVTKYDTSGTLQWQKTFSVNHAISSCTTDSAGNVYVGGADRSYGAGGGQITKLDTNGNIIWARTLKNGTANINSLHANSDGFLYVAGTYNTSTGAFLAKIPVDGSGTGTFGSWAYAVGTWTASATTYTGATTTLTSATTTLTAATSTLTAATPSVSYTVQEL